MIHLQEDGCIYSYGTVRFICISISSLVGRRVCSSAYKTAYTDAYISLENVHFVGLYCITYLDAPMNERGSIHYS
jgi:hypothetical protein